ncbi:efflux RND transporter permease subunit [Metapseudomonas otitidis]|uniref:efflux RND transporter permease subunit n=1 Tax=Metapseudomonas otitidis TaxID=319939 RepID=UPI00209A8B17|nr:efflux RND transporter permease subunit [Pseudomonas otitidis]MCO7557100.1 multidrug efflux RND transporter permease subunit [Pseudomonas otitidis]
MSQFFINRPKFAWVVALFISLAGLLAIPALPVAQYPSVAPPQISIGATYPGASAQVLVDSVTSVIEEELNGARGLLYFESTSNSNGSAEVTVTFQPGTDPQLAQVDVQNRLKKAEARLPQAVLTQGVQVEQASAGFLLIYALNYKPGTEHADTTALGDYAARHINNELRRVPGVGKLQFFSSEAAMRVWVDPQKLVGYGLSIDDVGSAIRGQNVQVPAGAFGSSPGSSEQELTATLAVKGTLDDPQAFGRIVLRANADGSRVTLADVARIEVGSENYNFAARLNGKPAVAGAIQLAPGANAIQTAGAVKQRLAELSVNFPDDVEYAVPYDTSRFVGVAIEKVIHTLLEAMVLVFLVMFLFLQNVRYTLIPSIVVPVCLLGTLAIMYGLGFSVNMMTMFGMVLAIGILVDDAIVVVENVERIMAEEGLPPVAATVKAMQQVSGAIVGITLVLAAVFLPLAFMGGSVGVIYQQFSLSLAVSILFSGFLALTFTPALCATLLKPIEGGHHQKRGFFGAFNRFFTAITERYTLLNHRLVRRAGRFMLVYLGLVAVLGYSYVRLPEAFVPAEDLGYNIVDVQLPPGATRARTDATAQQLEAFLQSREAIANSFLVMGFSFSGQGENAALAFPTFKDWSQRGPEQSAEAETAAVNARFAAPEDGSVMAVMPPPIDGLGNSGGFALRLQDRAGLGREALLAARDQLLGEANGNPKILYAMMEGLAEAPQLRLDIDREKARAHGVSFEAINSTLSTAFGSAVINDFSNSGRQQRVVVQAEQGARMTPESVLRLFVPNDRGEQVPLATFVTPRWEEGPVQIVRYNGYPSIRIAGDARYGVSSGEAMAEMERLASRLPEGIGYQWTGLSYQEQVASGQATQLFALAILVVFLLLVALYESWSIPFTVMLIVPIGALGAVLAVIVAGLANDVYFKVGLITIIGLAAKNAILIVEFAKELWEQGRSLGEAAIEAARLRFRPIVMTSLAFILGVVPLTLATGAGAASQRAIGTGVIGGMLGATLLGVVFVPVCFVWVLSLLRSRPAPVAQPVPAQE